jgi:Ca2+ transporting ATPase
MARSRPEDKYLLVTGLRNLDEVVAVTGDGTNDAPALTKADVGFGMGMTGTQVCKSAADIIILDDSFYSVVKACKWGRNVFDNIQRFLVFQLTVNVNALLTVFICSALMKGTPLQAIQLLWVNLIMDSLAALALATEMPKDHLLKRKPQRRSDFIVSRRMTKHILYMSIFQFIVIAVIVFWGEHFIPEPIVELRTDPADCCVAAGREYYISGEPLWFAERQINGNEYSRHITFVFHFFVFMQIWNMVCSRKVNDELNVFADLLTSWIFIIIWIIIVVLQFVIVAIGGKAFRLSPHGLSWEQHLWAVLIPLVVFIFNFILKFVPDRFAPCLGPDSVFDEREAKRLAAQ